MCNRYRVPDRVYYQRANFEIYEKIYLLTAYTKNEKDNLTEAERNELRSLVKILENQLRENEDGGKEWAFLKILKPA